METCKKRARGHRDLALKAAPEAAARTFVVGVRMPEVAVKRSAAGSIEEQGRRSAIEVVDDAPGVEFQTLRWTLLPYQP